jgi:hypothetical protein
MGPILAIAFGSVIMNRKLETKNCPGKMLFLTGIQNTFITIVEHSTISGQPSKMVHWNH